MPLALRQIGSSLRVRLLVLIGLAILPLLAVILLNVRDQRATITERVQSDALRVTQLIAANHRQYIDVTRQLLFTLAQLPAIRTGDLDSCNPLLADLFEQYPAYTNIYTIDVNGDSWCGAIPAPTGAVNVASADWFPVAMATDDFVLGNYEVGYLTGLPVIPTAMRLTDDSGQVMGLVGASLSLNWLNAFIAATPLPEGGALTVLDNRGIILARYPEPAGESVIGTSYAANPVYQEIVAGGEGVTQGMGTAESLRIYGYSRVGDEQSGLYVVVTVPEAVALAEVNRFQNESLIGLGLAALLVVAIAWVASNRLLVQPIGTLIDVTRRFGRGDLAARAAAPGIGELDTLAVSFNDMAHMLEARQAELTATNRRLEQANRDLLREIDERMQAEKASELKTQFLAMVSHELRTPLASIKGFATTLLADDVQWDLDQQFSFLQVIDQEADKLTELVSQLLDLAQLQAGTLRIQREAQSVGGVLQFASAQLATLTADHALQIADTEDLPLIDVDPTRVAQVLVNLVGNAARYAPPQTTIHIRAVANAAAGVVQFDVSDEGPGIPPDQRETVFEAFRQVDHKDGNQGKGAGLGLAVCKGIIESHGGRIWIPETSVGTTISFTVPLAGSPVATTASA